MEIITNAENRKELVKALSGHFGQRSEYLGPPSFAYRIGSITVDRDAKVILEDDSMEDEVRTVRYIDGDQGEYMKRATALIANELQGIKTALNRLRVNVNQIAKWNNIDRRISLLEK